MGRWRPCGSRALCPLGALLVNGLLVNGLLVNGLLAPSRDLNLVLNLSTGVGSLTGGVVVQASEAAAPLTSESRAGGLPGGDWINYDFNLASPYRSNGGPSYEDSNVGFRVASVPEPTTVMLTILGSRVLVTRRKR